MFPRDQEYADDCIFIRKAERDVKQNLVEIYSAGGARLSERGAFALASDRRVALRLALSARGDVAGVRRVMRRI
jgi:hypothetical protein